MLGRTISHYHITSQLGEGGMGIVYEAEDTNLGRHVALKFLTPALASDENLLQRFQREARAASALNHPNICTIHGIEQHESEHFIVMELLDGESLGDRIRRGPLDLESVLTLGVQLADALESAHSKGIVHRDLKPANVLIDNDSLLKIVDFGVAAAQSQGDTQLTKTGYVIGSPKYMAPEQILGKKVDERADIYSLGVILYELFTGVPPYSRGDHMSVMYQHVQGKARQPIEINKNLPQELNDLVVKCMSLDKAKRAQTMDDLRASLEKFL